MRLFERFKRYVADYGLVGPHQDAELELLLAGKKPLGFFAIDRAEAPEHCQLTAQTIQNVRILDTAVDDGTLLKAKISGSKKGPLPSTEGHLYAQTDNQGDLLELAAHMEAIWAGKSEHELPTLSRDIGLMLGYSKRDVELWSGGDWKESSFCLRFILHRTTNIRRTWRQEQLLAESSLDKS